MAERPDAKQSSTGTESKSTAAESQPQNPPGAAVEDDDSDPDFDDLDDVLDQFSEARATQQQQQQQQLQQRSEPSEPTPSSSGPGRPGSEAALPPDIPLPSGPHENESEDAFMARLTAEMSSVMSKMSLDPAASAATPEDIAKMGRELEEFTQKMEAEGIQPEDLLKAILGEDAGSKVSDLAHDEHDRRESESKGDSKPMLKSKASESTSAETSSRPAKEDRPSSSSPSSSSKTAPKQPSTSFEDTIRRTMARMSESSAAATSATTTATQQKSEEDLLADLLRSLDSDSGNASEGDLSKMFLSMMEQLTNKEMLYEPMKELAQKFPDYLEANDPKVPKQKSKSGGSGKASKLSPADFDRFTRQHKIVGEIVAKFEEPSFSDEDPKCREFIWEKMQEMQAEGAPPEELVANPFPGVGMGGSLGGGSAGAGGEGPEEGCPTQ
ncbi:putative peroxisomal membrane protein receptor Pex19 [Cladophialophora carrionii]|uniref:Putative peroxisomal membrane protein receptor Pex19 n=1 Tax=Cladophialophora carrionii TaxID=86049 RepID=A0A1C1CUM5_9EURO|nr:putative peroxisomal membrane protein receptor Pex19 [Cladophialophora carrionii]